MDDKESVRSMLRLVLQGQGVQVQVAEDGLAAWSSIERMPPDLILSDINMDGLDGFALLDRVRRTPAVAQIPFILMTGKADLHSMRNGMSLGADDYLPKPFTTAELLATIHRRLERHDALQLEAESRMSSLRDSISLMLPHELLTPLNGILGIAALLEEGDVPQDELTAFGGMLRESGDRLHRLVLNFLTLARLELLAHEPANGRPRTETCFTGGQWIQDCAFNVADRWKRVDDFLCRVDSLTLRIGRHDCEKAITEILDNAFKFSRRSSPVRLICEASGGRARISIRDSGRGMQKSDIDSVGAFRQFDRKLHEQQGTGLGLIIARRLVEFHGGTLVIESEVGAGTMVEVFLPVV